MNQTEPLEKLHYFFMCLDCAWESLEPKMDPDKLSPVEFCPKCESTNIQMAHDFIEVR